MGTMARATMFGCWLVLSLGLTVFGLVRWFALEMSIDSKCASIKARVSRAFPSWDRSILTEIYLCHAFSYHEVEDGNAPDRNVWASRPSGP
jgi:glycerol-3-phosphate acyltransferase PlsY